jgi:hypothetical protein
MVAYLSRRNSKATGLYWDGAIRVLRYLYSTKDSSHCLSRDIEEYSTWNYVFDKDGNDEEYQPLSKGEC